MFQLTEEEYDSFRSQIVTSNKGRGGRRYLPRIPLNTLAPSPLVSLHQFQAGFLIGGILEYLLKIVNLGGVISNPAVRWGMIAITQGIFLGLLFIGFRRFFTKKEYY